MLYGCKLLYYRPLGVYILGSYLSHRAILYWDLTGLVTSR
jgi:hypothetical protein